MSRNYFNQLTDWVAGPKLFQPKRGGINLSSDHKLPTTQCKTASQRFLLSLVKNSILERPARHATLHSHPRQAIHLLDSFQAGSWYESWKIAVCHPYQLFCAYLFKCWRTLCHNAATYTDLVLHVGCQLWKKSTKQRFFVVRELDTKILRAPTSSSTTSSNTLVVTSASSQKDAKGSSEQAIRAGIRSDYKSIFWGCKSVTSVGIRTQILKQNLDARNANKEELDSLKRLNVVGCVWYIWIAMPRSAAKYY